MGHYAGAVSLSAASLVALLVVSVCPESRCRAASGGEWRDRFLSEAPRKWEAYRSFAKRLQGTNTHKTYQGREATGPPFEEWRYEWRQRGQWTRSVSQESGPQVARGIPPAEVKAVNSRYAFVLRKQTPTSDWVLVTFDTDLRDDRPINPREREKVVLDSFCVGLQVKGRLFSEITQESGFVLKAVNVVPSNGRDLVRIDFAHRHSRETDKHSWEINRQMWLSIDGWVVLDPEACWSIRECEVKTTHLGGVQGTTSFTNEYKQTDSGFPLMIRRVQHTRYADPTGARETMTVSTYDWYVDDAVPESEFTLSAFGLPEPPGIDWKRPTPWWLYAGVAGVVCLVLAFVLRWLARCRATQRPTSS